MLWEKLIKNAISGKIIIVIKDMYHKAKSCVKTPNGISSSFFLCNVGVRQGENLSPILFSLFLNDLRSYLSEHIDGLLLPWSISKDLDFPDIDLFFKLFLLLYADDTVIISESAKDMQKALDFLKIYCDRFGLSINTTKTKVMIFSRGKVRKLPVFKFSNVVLEIVWEYKYLGTLFQYNNKFHKNIKAQSLSAERAMYALLKKGRKLDLPLDVQIELFDKCVKPILLYNCEVWAHEKMELCDKLQLKFLKMILNVKTSTPTCMVLGEVGCYPVSLDAKCRLLCFWFKLCIDVCNGSTKISVLMFRLCSQLFLSSEYKLSWLNTVRSLLNDLGLSYMWLYGYSYSLHYFKNLVKQRLRDQFLQAWHQSINEQNSCITYRIFKESFCFEDYLLSLPPVFRLDLCKFRLSCHKLPIQTQRYINIPREERLCPLCDLNEIGDEFHYLFNCTNSLLNNNRIFLLPRYLRKRPNVYKFNQLMYSKSKRTLINLCRFIGMIFSLFY